MNAAQTIRLSNQRPTVRRAVGLLLPVLLAVGATVAMVSTPAGAKPPSMKKPGAPTDVTVAPVEGGTTVSWQPPKSDGGDPITGYLATARHGSTCSTTGALTCTILGLTDGRQYKVSVQATNGIGTGRPSNAKPVIAGRGPDCSALEPDADLAYCHYNHQDLADLDLEGANLTGASMVDATLDGADLDNAILYHANLQNASLQNTSLVDADLDTAALINDSLDGADLTDASLFRAYFTEVGLVNANLTGSDYGDAIDIYNDTFGNTTCPDGTNSDNDAGTCLNDLG